MMELKSMHILLTGATGGIGQEIAEQLVKHGVELTLVGRDGDKLTALKNRLLAANEDPTDKLTSITTDLSSTSGRTQLFQQLSLSGQVPNVLINCIGTNEFGLYQEQTSSSIIETIHTNTLTPMLLIHDYLNFISELSLPAVQVINVGSTFGSIGYPGFSAYSASKFAIRGFSEALAREMTNSNISIRYFAPRATQTTLNSSQVVHLNQQLNVKMDSPEFVAREFIRFLAGEQRRKYVGWPEKILVRLNQLFPALIDLIIGQKLPIIQQHARSPSVENK